MNHRTASQTRQDFLDFFVEKHGHTVVPSSPVVPLDDPTLLFANAGMNQFKPIFLGTETRAYTRAVNSQKCIRAGGKHNDLEDVGKDSYHHTFFEMLGNWSFGDYFKEDAIRWSWQLLTEVWGLDKNRLYATVFGGDEEEGLPPDEEAEELWKSVTDIDPTHVSRWGKKDNFWEMGETGPCGPCTEIHYDFTEDLSGGPLVNADDERVIELWNNVFIQFNRAEGGTLSPLPAQHVDTGMGFERLVRVLQGKASNYDIDLWIPIFMAIEQRSGARSYGGRLNDPTDIAYRVIADHMRCLTFAITDGALPGNEGRGYVLRRILRRSVRHGRQTLGVPKPFLYHLVPSVIEAMGEAFPEIKASASTVADVIHEEEESFGRTLDRGIDLFTDAAKRAEREDSTVISADDAFKLHDTYGFPIDLTEVMAEERSMTVDLDGYERLMEEARERARAGGSKGKEGETLKLEGDQIARLRHLRIEPTIDDTKFTSPRLSARVVALWNGRDFEEHINVAGKNHLVGIITNKTNFYAEMGGQVGDTGRIHSNNGDSCEIVDTKVFGGYVLHIGRCTRGKLSVGENVEMELDLDRRAAIQANHTGTHLLNLALREALGDHVDQKGSLVAPDRLRFDFSHSGSMTAEQAEQITSLVSERIHADLKLFAHVSPLDQARTINGLRAVFGEHYPDPVRVVSIGKPVEELLANPTQEEWRKYSVEFCGGTHVSKTSEIVAFELTAEEAVAKGVRRVIALTGGLAAEARAAARDLESRVNVLESASDEDLPLRLAELIEQIEEVTLPYADRAKLRTRTEALHDRAKAIRKQQERAGASAVVDQARAIADSADAGSQVIVAELKEANQDSLRGGMDVLRSKHPDAAILLITADHDEGKVSMVASVPKGAIDKGLKAGDWVREVAKVCGGGGGGRPDMAQAGGKDPSKVSDAIAKAHEFVQTCFG